MADFYISVRAYKAPITREQSATVYVKEGEFFRGDNILDSVKPKGYSHEAR